MRSVVLPLWLSLSLAACSLLVETDPAQLGQSDGRDMDDIQGEPDGGADDDPGPDYDSGCGDCDDDLACTRDDCNEGSCRHTPDDDECAEGERCQTGRGCIPRRCSQDADCDDGDLCNGAELCDPDAAGADAESGCVPGAVLDCADIVPCTVDRCDAAQGCVHEADDSACGDGVDCTADACDEVLGCRHEPDNQRCDACLIASICDRNLGCLGGIARPCSDGDACTIDECSVELGMCMHMTSPDCNPTTPDSCSQAEEIALVNGHGEVRGSFVGLAPSYDTSCGQTGGRDAVYRIHIDSLADVILDTAGSGAKTALAVAAKSCDAQGFELGCAGAVSPSVTSSRLILHHYDPAVHGADLFILVDAANALEVGDYVLGVEVYGAAQDSCEAPLPLSECGTLVGFIDEREPANFWGEQRGNCQNGQGMRAPEAIVSIAGSSDGNVSLVASSDSFAPALYARTVCDSRDNDVQLGCENSASANGQSGAADFTVELDANERAFVIVDGGRNGAKYTLRCTP